MTLQGDTAENYDRETAFTWKLLDMTGVNMENAKASLKSNAAGGSAVSKEPVRLVCPDCDTVHRVRSVTLGKVYRCKKCGAGLVTLAPAVLACTRCGAKSEPAHVDVSRVTTCTNCPDAPLLTVTFPADAKSAPAREAPPAPQVDPEKIGEAVRRSIRETVADTVKTNVRETVREVVQGMISREFAALDIATVTEKHLANLDAEARQREERLVRDFQQELARLLAVRMGEFSRLLHEHEEQHQANLHQAIRSELAEKISALAPVIEEIQERKDAALREALEQGLSLHLAEARAGRAEVAQLAQDLQDKVREPLASIARESEERGKQLAAQLQAGLSAFAGEQIDAIRELMTADSDRLTAKFADRISADLEKLSADYQQQADRLREDLAADLKTSIVAELDLLTARHLDEFARNISRSQDAGATAVQQQLAAVEQSLAESATRQSDNLNQQIADVLQRHLDALRTDIFNRMEEAQARIPDLPRTLQEFAGEITQHLKQETAESESRLQQAFADRIRSAMLAQAEKLSELNSERESEIAQRVQQELDRVLASVPDGESLSEVRVDQLVTENMERILGEHLDKMQRQSKQVSRELQEVFQQATAEKLQAAIQDMEESILAQLKQLEMRKTGDETAAIAEIRESLRLAEERIAGAVDERLPADITAVFADAMAESDQAADNRARKIVEQVTGGFADRMENLEHAIREADHSPETVEIQTAITSALARLKTDLEAGIGKALSAAVRDETRSALEGALSDLPQVVETRVVAPLEHNLSEKIPQMLGRLQEDELAKTFGNAARESRQAITAEVRQAAGATITWISWVAVPLILILFAPLAFIAWQVRSLPDTAAAPAAVLPEQALDTRLQQIQEQVSLLGARQNAKTLKLERDLAAVQKLRQDLIQRNTVLGRDNQALKKSLADYRQAIEKWRVNADKWQKLAQDNYKQVQELKRKLQQLGASPKNPPMPEKRETKKTSVPKWP